MKAVAVAVAITLASATSALAQSSDMKSMDMKGMDMKGMDQKSMAKDDKSTKTHTAVGVVRKNDPKAGTVTIDHEPVKSLNWPAMSMAFKVKDKAMLDKLAVDKKVQVEFQQQGKDNVITAVK